MRSLLILITAVILHAAEFRAGVAKADLDPPTGLPMAGYGVRYSKGTLDPLEARVLVLSDGPRTIAFVTLDLCFPFDPPVMDEIRRASRRSVYEIIFHVSRTHSGTAYSEAPQV